MPDADVTTWEEFSERLFRVLLTIDARVYLIVETKPSLSQRYVQFASSTEDLVGEAMGPTLLPEEYKLDADAQARMRELGWENPKPDWSQFNWNCMISLPRTQERRLRKE